jgi:hypothetical protein
VTIKRKHSTTTMITVECFRCGKEVPCPDSWGKSNGIPEGYIIHLMRITSALNVSKGDAYFCSKDCLLEGIKWGASHITNGVE